jgi:DNA-binding MarR family transcriptional regulator
VTRVADRADRRVVRVKITEEGARLAREGEREFTARVQALVAGLPTADREVLAGLASRVVAAVTRESPEAG